jgi:hypothetical protein
MPIPTWLHRPSVDARHSDAIQTGNYNTQINNSQVTLQVQVPVEWPIAEGDPPLLATAFQERPGIKRLLEAALAPAGSTTVMTQVLAGDGGIGKTQLAVRSYECAYTSDAYDLCLWITATSASGVVTWYARTMRRIDPNMDSEDLVGAARRFLTWLRETRHTWFIVLDDVADPADIDGWWPTGLHGRTLVTTRRQDASLSEHGRTIINVDVFTEIEARAYLTSRLSASQTRQDALEGSSELTAALGCLPLALSQAAAVILDDGITCLEYRKRFADRAVNLDKLFPTLPDNRQRTVSTTWSLAIEAADLLTPRGLSKPLLDLISVLESNGIPENVLMTDAARTFIGRQLIKRTGDSPIDPAAAAHQMSSSEEQRGALRALHRLSLIVHDPTDAEHSVRMHALAQRATREALGKLGNLEDETLRNTYTAAADALVQAWPNIERDAALSTVLRQNAIGLRDLASEVLWGPDAHPVLFRAGRSMEEVGLIGAALDYWQELLPTAMRILGPEHPDSLTIRRELAYCQGQSGNPFSAMAALESLLADAVQIIGNSHRETLAIRRDLAWWRGETRNPVGAVAAYEELLADMLQALGPDDPETLTVRYSLGRWRGQAGGPQPAINDFKALLEECLRIAGPAAPLTLAVRHDLAWWLGESGDAAAAVAAFASLLPDRQRILGPNHPYTLATRHDLAWWKWDAGDHDCAKFDLESVLADYLSVMGPGHPHTAAVGDDLEFLIAGGQHGETHGQIRDTAQRVPGDLPGLDFLQPADARVGWRTNSM